MVVPPIQVFVSYSRTDQRWIREDSLIPWLARSLKKDKVDLWWDKEGILPGDEFRRLIEREIDRSLIALLLVSQEFLNSEFIERVELTRVEARAHAGQMTVIPILLEPCVWEELEFLSGRQMLPGKPTPLINYTESDREWAEVRAEILGGIRRAVARFRAGVIESAVAAESPSANKPSSGAGSAPLPAPAGGKVAPMPSRQSPEEDLKQVVGVLGGPPGTIDEDKAGGGIPASGTLNRESTAPTDVPTADVTEELVSRFGLPRQRITLGEHVVYYFYDNLLVKTNAGPGERLFVFKPLSRSEDGSAERASIPSYQGWVPPDSLTAHAIALGKLMKGLRIEEVVLIGGAPSYVSEHMGIGPYWNWSHPALGLLQFTIAGESLVLSRVP
jgi:hypothetical protein